MNIKQIRSEGRELLLKAEIEKLKFENKKLEEMLHKFKYFKMNKSFDYCTNATQYLVEIPAEIITNARNGNIDSIAQDVGDHFTGTLRHRMKKEK